MPSTHIEFQHEAVHRETAYFQGDQMGILLELTRNLGIELDERQCMRIQSLVEEHFGKIRALMDERMFPGLVAAFGEEDVVEYFTGKLTAVLEENPTYAAIILDRAVYNGIASRLQEYGQRIQHFSLTRPASNMFTVNSDGKVPRIGDPSFEDQAARIASEIEGYQAFIVDDTYVEGGTSRAARELLSRDGVVLAPVEEDRFHFRAVRETNKSWQDAHARLLMLDSVASAEQREFTAIGGNHNGASRSNRMGYVVPGFAPFSNGGALRLADRLDLNSISQSILDIDIDYVSALEMELGRALRLIDVRRSIPTDAADEGGVRSLLQEYIRVQYPSDDDRHVNFITFLRQTKLTDFLRFARSKLDTAEKPTKDIVCVDMDGVIAHMQHVEGEGVGFKGSKLERSVRENALRLIMDLEGVDHEMADDILNGTNTELGLASFFTQHYGELLEQKYGESAKSRIREIFADVYPAEQAAGEAETFIQSMPLAYHVFRVWTWDHNLDEIYESNDDAAPFARNIVDRGGKLMFVSAAPRIHALKMLKHQGISDALTLNQWTLHSVEDMYEPGTVAAGTYREGNKGTTLQRIHEETGVPLERIAMGGDQFKSDVCAPLRAGVQSAIIRGPHELNAYAEMVLLPKDAERVAVDSARLAIFTALSNDDGAETPLVPGALTTVIDEAYHEGGNGRQQGNGHHRKLLDNNEHGVDHSRNGNGRSHRNGNGHHRIAPRREDGDKQDIAEPVVS